MHYVQVSAEEYAAVQPDPITKFSAPVAGHMNEVGAGAAVHALRCTPHARGCAGVPSAELWPSSTGQWVPAAASGGV